MDPNDTNYIKQIIKDYILVNEELTNINKQVKDIRMNKVNLENIIKQHMIDNNVAQYDYKTGIFKVSKSKVAKKLNKKVITDALIEKLEEDTANDILDTLFDESELEEVTKLEFKKSKKGK